jgi:hypothetical protein
VLNKTALQELFAAQAPFDILISAATGGERAFGPFLKMDMDGYAASFDKLWGYANVIRFGTEHLSPDGCIVLVSGTPAKRAKAGQISLASVGASVEHLVRYCGSPEQLPCACDPELCLFRTSLYADPLGGGRAGATTHQLRFPRANWNTNAHRR